jgi:hypothetical protein
MEPLQWKQVFTCEKNFTGKTLFLLQGWVCSVSLYSYKKSQSKSFIYAKYNSWCRKEFLLTKYVSCINTSMASYVGLLLVLSIRILIISCVLCKMEKKNRGLFSSLEQSLRSYVSATNCSKDCHGLTVKSNEQKRIRDLSRHFL